MPAPNAGPGDTRTPQAALEALAAPAWSSPRQAARPRLVRHNRAWPESSAFVPETNQA
jgi:hypothetical protein